MFTAKDVMSLRQRTGAGMMEAKKALEESKGDMDKAAEQLRVKGIAKADKRSGKQTSEGVITSYVHHNGKVGVLVEVNCETDFAARSDDFQSLVKDIAMHVAALNPRWVRRDEVTAEDLQKEKEIYKEQARTSGKPENIVEKIAEGKLESFYKETCLYDQAFVKDPNLTVEQLITNLVGKIGENIRVRRFVRFVTGEGLEKRSTDLKGEVEGMLGGN